MNSDYSNKIFSVLSFAINNNFSPLRFEEYKSPVKIFDRKDVDKMVLRALELTQKYASANVMTRKIETEAGKRRSALDIWRHISYYYPNVSIFSVMRSLYKLCSETDSKVLGVYCSRIERRTFRLVCTTTYYPSEYKDEFGLKFEDWKEI